MSKRALIIVDPQNDFCPGGTLAVVDGDKIMSKISKLTDNKYFDIIIVTKDWHPKSHKRFIDNNVDAIVFKEKNINGIVDIIWPSHCVQDTFGAELHKDLVINREYFIVEKGQNEDIHPYSGFGEDLDNSELDNILNMNEIDTVYVCGLATDFCCFDTAKDAVMLGYDTFFIADLTKSINDFNTSINTIKSYTFDNNKIKIINSDIF